MKIPTSRARALPTSLMLLILSALSVPTLAIPLKHSLAPVHHHPFSLSRTSIPHLNHQLEHRPNASPSSSIRESLSTSIPSFDASASDDHASENTGKPALLMNSYPFEDRIGISAAILECMVVLAVILAWRRWGAPAWSWCVSPSEKGGEAGTVHEETRKDNESTVGKTTVPRREDEGTLGSSTLIRLQDLDLYRLDESMRL